MRLKVGLSTKRDVPDGQVTEEDLEVTIERILPGGVGLAHAEGRTFFVGLAAPGDVVRVRIDRIRGKLAFASIAGIVKPSPVRVQPPCPYFGRCGGCDFQQLTYQAQLEAKVEMIGDCLRRIAGIGSLPRIPIIASPQQWRYRSRANWQQDLYNGHLGYFERGSHRVCDVEECGVLVPELQETLSRLRARTDSDSSSAFSEIQAVVGAQGPSVAPPIKNLPTRDVSCKVGSETYYLNAEVFFQVNQDLLGLLVNGAISDVQGDTAVDLYCGVGLFTLPLARKFGRVTGVEANPAAAGFARRNLRNAGLANARIECGRVGPWLGTNGQRFGPVDLLLLDPPRSGLEDGVIAGLLHLEPKRISYVSCDPATLARDLKALLAGDGYRLDTMSAFDIFPQTHHVETLVHLIRSC